VNCVTIYVDGKDRSVHIAVDFHSCIHEPLKLQVTRPVFGTGVVDGTMLDSSDAVVLFQLEQATPGLGTGGSVLAPFGRRMGTTFSSHGTVP
jgi:hypothetical protein